MKRHDTPAELLKTRRELSGIARQTRSLIGRVARDGYNALCVLPTDGASNDTMWADADSVFGEEQFDLDVPTIPGGSARLPSNPNLQVTRAETQLHAKRVGGKQLVGVGVGVRSLTSDVSSSRSELFTVVSDGNVFAFDNYGYTEPLAPRLHMRTKENLGQFAYDDYCNTAEQMRDHYARQCTGALAVTGLVVASLNTAFGVGLETPELEPLLASWREIAATERGAIDPQLFSFLPSDLAMHVGATS